MPDTGNPRDWDRRLVLAACASAFAAPRAGLAQPATSTPSKRKLSEIIATYVTDFDLAKTPPEVVELARVGFLDTVGVMLAGSQEQVAAIALDMVREEASAPAATIVGHDLRASPQLAALANGVAAHAMDYDFSYASGQAVSAVIPALLPLAESRGATPSEVISAFVISAEVAARLVRASPKISALGGWHATGMVGAIAAAVASARLMKLPASRIPDAVGISVSLASGVSANFGTMTKPLHSGNAARSGVMAAQLAARGFTASAIALEGPSGYYATFSRGLETSMAPFEDLGKVHNFVDPGYRLKRYPCGGLAHAAIDATLALRDQLVGRVADIAKIEVGVTRHAFQEIGSAYPNSIESAKFSMPYIGAWTVLHGAPAIATFTQKSIDEAAVKALAPKISHHVDAQFADELAEAPGRVVVTMTNGETLEKMVWYASGSPKNPMTPAQIEAKFFDCAKQAMKEDQAKQLFDWLVDLPKQASFAEFWKMARVTG
jgi:2-methylcitrate dehydratase PrpD